MLLALLAVPALASSYWLLIMTGVAIYSIVTLGLGLLIGRVGMVSLCQFVLLAIGAWVSLRLSYALSLPFPVLILAAGAITGAIGMLIGLPALRLSGLYLALVTREDTLAELARLAAVGARRRERLAFLLLEAAIPAVIGGIIGWIVGGLVVGALASWSGVDPVAVIVGTLLSPGALLAMLVVLLVAVTVVVSHTFVGPGP